MNFMPKKEIYTCDKCDSPLLSATDGFLVEGVIGHAHVEPGTAEPLIDGNKALCRKCLLIALFGKDDIICSIEKPLKPAYLSGYTNPTPIRRKTLEEHAAEMGGYLNGDGIILLRNGKYAVRVNIQDGTENCGEYDDEMTARQKWIESVKALNGIDRSMWEVGLFKCP